MEQRQDSRLVILQLNPGAQRNGNPKENIMSKSNIIMAFAILSIVTASNLVAQNASASDDPGNNPSCSNGEPGNNPSNGGDCNPAPRSDHTARSSNIVYSAPLKGNIKLDHSGFGPNSHLKPCRLCQMQQFR